MLNLFWFDCQNCTFLLNKFFITTITKRIKRAKDIARNKLMNQMSALRSSRSKSYILLGISPWWPFILFLKLKTGLRNLKLNLKYWKPSMNFIHSSHEEVLKWVIINTVCIIIIIEQIGSIDLSVFLSSLRIWRVYICDEYITYWKIDEDYEKEDKHSNYFYASKAIDCKNWNAFSSFPIQDESIISFASILYIFAYSHNSCRLIHD